MPTHNQVFGAWTSALHALATFNAGAAVPVRLEGPYGYDWAAPARERLLMGGPANAVAFVAGGVGISPFAALIAALVQTAPHALRSLKVRIRHDDLGSMYDASTYVYYSRCNWVIVPPE